MKVHETINADGQLKETKTNEERERKEMKEKTGNRKWRRERRHEGSNVAASSHCLASG